MNTTRSKTPVSASTTQSERISNLLSGISANCSYEIWFQVGAILHNEGVDYAVFRDWSATCPKKFDEAECRRQWDSYREVENPITIGTLVKMANGTAPQGPTSVPVPKPLSAPATLAERLQQADKFLKVLFRPGETIELPTATWNDRTKKYVPRRRRAFHKMPASTDADWAGPLAASIDHAENGLFLALNPGDPDKLEGANAFSSSAIADYRYALVEYDDIAIEQQWKVIENMRIPVAAAVFSGHTSVHLICRIDAGNDANLFKERVQKLYAYVGRFGIQCDAHCKDPARLTRFPGAKRGNQLQYVLAWSFGYRNWQDFEKAELQEPPSVEETLLRELDQELGPVFDLDSRGSVKDVNGDLIGRYILRTQPLQKEGAYWWHYDAESGLWKILGEEAQNEFIAEQIRKITRLHGDALFIVNPKHCKNTVSFMVPPEREPFSRKVPNTIHVANGMLAIGADEVKLLPFGADYRSRNRCELEYDPQAQCPRFLTELLGPVMSEDDIGLLQQYAGQCLMASNQYQKILYLYGDAGSGKGTTVNIIEQLIGRENTAELRTAQLDKQFEESAFIGKSLLCGKDVSSNYLEDRKASRLKALSGGDTMTTEIKHCQDRAPIKGDFNIIIVGNKPSTIHIDGDTDAWKRRLLLIECASPQHKKPIPNFAEHLLQEEGPGILRWAVEGAQKLIRNGGFILSPAEELRRDQLLNQSDSPHIFVQQGLIKTGNWLDTITSEQLYDKYCDFCDTQGWVPKIGSNARAALAEEIRLQYGLMGSNHIPCGTIMHVSVRGFRGLQFAPSSIQTTAQIMSDGNDGEAVAMDLLLPGKHPELTALSQIASGITAGEEKVSLPPKEHTVPPITQSVIGDLGLPIPTR